MSTTTTTISGLLKNVYDKYLERAQNLEHRTIDEIGKSLKKFNPGGKGFFGAINDYGNEAGGAQNETESFRTIDNENYTQWKVTPKVITWPIEFSGLSAAVADEDQESFASSVVDALDQAKQRMMSDENRQFFGVGTGVLASPSTTIASTATSFTVDSTQYLRRNMVIDVFNGATKTVDSQRITRVDHQNKVIHFASSFSVVLEAADELVKENIRDSAPSDGKEMMGLRGIVDDSTDLTTFQNIDASANDEWQATRIAAGSVNLTSDLLQRLLDDTAILGGEESDLLITHRKQRRKYLDIVVPQKRYQDGNMDTGFTELNFNGQRMLLDKDCQSDTFYSLKKRNVRKFEVKPMQMGGYEGSDKFLRATGQDVYQGFWVHYCNFGANKRTSLGKLTGLASSAGIS